jgi:hypothetical protein
MSVGGFNHPQPSGYIFYMANLYDVVSLLSTGTRRVITNKLALTRGRRPYAQVL